MPDVRPRAAITLRVPGGCRHRRVIVPLIGFFRGVLAVHQRGKAICQILTTASSVTADQRRVSVVSGSI